MMAPAIISPPTRNKKTLQRQIVGRFFEGDFLTTTLASQSNRTVMYLVYHMAKIKTQGAKYVKKCLTAFTFMRNDIFIQRFDSLLRVITPICYGIKFKPHRAEKQGK